MVGARFLPSWLASVLSAVTSVDVRALIFPSPWMLFSLTAISVAVVADHYSFLVTSVVVGARFLPSLLLFSAVTSRSSYFPFPLAAVFFNRDLCCAWCRSFFSRLLRSSVTSVVNCCGGRSFYPFLASVLSAVTLWSRLRWVLEFIPLLLLS